MKVTYTEVLELNQTLNVLSTKNVSAQAVLQVLNIKDEVAEHAETYIKALDQVMSDYSVDKIEGKFDWTEHADKEAITLKHAELKNTEVEVAFLNTISLEDVIALTSGQSVGAVTYFRHYLLKK